MVSEPDKVYYKIEYKYPVIQFEEHIVVGNVSQFKPCVSVPSTVRDKGVSPCRNDWLTRETCWLVLIAGARCGFTGFFCLTCFITSIRK